MRNKIVEVISIILLFTLPSYSNEEKVNFHKVSLSSVYDGDTFRVHLACKYGVFCKTIPIRVRGVDCPEIKGGSTATKELAKQKLLLKTSSRVARFCYVTAEGTNTSGCSVMLKLTGRV